MLVLTRSLVLVMALILAVGCAQPPASEGSAAEAEAGAAQPQAAGLDGVYEFVRLETPDGPQSTQHGLMIVQGGYLCHVRVGNEREKFTEGEAEAEQARKAAAAFSSSNAACGKYQLAGDRVSASWSVSANPNVEGNTTEFILTSQAGELILAPAAAPQFKFVYRPVASAAAL